MCQCPGRCRKASINNAFTLLTAHFARAGLVRRMCGAVFLKYDLFVFIDKATSCAYCDLFLVLPCTHGTRTNHRLPQHTQPRRQQWFGATSSRWLGPLWTMKVQGNRLPSSDRAIWLTAPDNHQLYPMRARDAHALWCGNMTVIHLCSDWTASAFIYYGFHVEGKKETQCCTACSFIFYLERLHSASTSHSKEHKSE